MYHQTFSLIILIVPFTESVKNKFAKKVKLMLTLPKWQYIIKSIVTELAKGGGINAI